jgi:hypothetical protein
LKARPDGLPGGPGGTAARGGLGAGIGWRPEIDLTVPRLPGVEWVEVVAEKVDPGAVPASLAALHQRGLPVIPHGVSLSLGGTVPVDD